MNEVNVLKGNLFLSIFKLAIPLMILNIFNSLYSLVDTFFVGQIGELAVGAISLTSPIVWCAISIANGLATGAMAIVSKNYGAGDYQRASRFASEFIYFSIFFSLLLTGIVFCLCNPILNYLHTPTELYTQAYDYLKIMSFDYLGLFFITIYMAIRQACGDSKSGMIVSACASILNIILDPIFIFVLGLGVQGAGIATVLSKLIVVPYILYSLCDTKQKVHISFSTHIQYLDCIYIMQVSIPCAFGQFLESLGFVLMNKFIVGYGAIAISAYGVGQKLTDLFNIPIMAFCNTLPTFIGQNLGAENSKRARDSYKLTMLITVVLGVILFVVGMALADYMILIFIPNASSQLIEIAKTLLFFTLLTGPLCSWYFNLCSVFNGSGHTTISFGLGILRLWGTRIPLIYLFSYITNWQINGIWMAMLVSNLITSIIAQIIYQVYPWTKMKKSF